MRTRAIIDERPTYRARRVHALLHRKAGHAPVNHKWRLSRHEAGKSATHERVETS